MSRLTIICVALGMILFAGCAQDPSSSDPGMHAGGPPPLRGTDQLRPAPAPARIETTPPETVAAAPATAESVSPQPVAPAPQPVVKTHTLQKGDTLWSLATKYLGDGKRWPEIVALNPGLEPKTLTVGKTVNIPAR